MDSKRKKILEEVLPLRLIREVEKWPVLYSRDCPEKSNAHFRNKVWLEVARNLVDGWDSLSQPERDSKATDCSKKWRHLQDTYKRRYKYQRKEYVYSKYMAFLNPHLEPPAPADRLKPRLAADKQSHRAASRSAAKPPAAAARRPDGAETRLLAGAIEHIDEDEHFLMSLLPSFRKMSDDEKLTAKMEILRVIKEVRAGPADSSPVPLGPGPVPGDADVLRLSLEPHGVGIVKIESMSDHSDS